MPEIREVRIIGEHLGHAMTIGEVISIGRRMYATCTRCRRVVQLNKVLFGSLHICEEQPRPVVPEYQQEPDEPEEAPATRRPPPPQWPEARQRPPS